jgi:hypothetical protein
LLELRLEQGCDPDQVGIYVAYVNDEYLKNFAQKKFLFWTGSRWGYPMSDQNYRGHVYGWIGPLPAMRLED